MLQFQVHAARCSKSEPNALWLVQNPKVAPSQDGIAPSTPSEAAGCPVKVEVHQALASTHQVDLHHCIMHLLVQAAGQSTLPPVLIGECSVWPAPPGLHGY